MVSRAEFNRLLDAYVGAYLHSDWAADFATPKVQKLAKKAAEDARKALEKAVFG